MLSFELPLPFNLDINVIALADVLAAAAVTAHVLLKKQDVRAAIGWIGLAWLSPIIGSILYYLFGINRVTRRAARLSTGEVGARLAPTDAAPSSSESSLPANITAVAQAGDRLTSNPLVDGNAISLFCSGDEAYLAMLNVIAAARYSVALSSYIFRLDRIGRRFIDALQQARERGIEVRILVDGIGSGYVLSSVVRELRRADIPVARFMHNWLPWRMPFLNMRNHKKLLIVDGRIGFMGGLNIGAENLRRRYRGAPVEDIHFRVDGPVVSQLMRTFAEDWIFTTGESLQGIRWWPEIARTGQILARGISSGPDEDLGNLETILAAAIAAAKQKFRIVTPYFLPDQRLLFAIELAVLRGVKIEIVLPRQSDHRLLDWAVQAHLGFFAVPGVAVYLSSTPFDHSKLATADGIWCAFGSANWDIRSLRLNFEFMLETYGSAIASEIDRVIDGKIARAQLLALPDGRSLPTRLRDGAARLLLPYL